MQKLLRLADVLERTSLSRTKIYELMAENAFPKPAKVATRNCWSEAEVAAWIEQTLETREAA